MKNFLLLFVMILLGAAGCGSLIKGDLIEGKPVPFNPLIGFWQKPEMMMTDAENLANFSVVVLDIENFFNNPELVSELLKTSEIWIYVNPMEVFDPMIAGRPWQAALKREIDSLYSGWYLKNIYGESIYYWDDPPMKMLNLSIWCPEYRVMDREGGRQDTLKLKYFQWIAARYVDFFRNNPVARGIVVDNCWRDVSWIGNVLDANGDSISDNPDGWQEGLPVDTAWREGVSEMLSLLRCQLGSSRVIVVNQPNLYFLESVNGKLFEDFPTRGELAGSTSKAIQRYLEMGQLGRGSIIMSPAEADSAKVMFDLAVALLGDGYYCQGINLSAPKFSIDYFVAQLGAPQDGPNHNTDDDSYSRIYFGGMVRVWASADSARIIIDFD